MGDHTARVRTQAGELRGRNFIVRAAMVKKQASCWPEATEVLKSRGNSSRKIPGLFVTGFAVTQAKFRSSFGPPSSRGKSRRIRLP
jgi:hypothetical protein